MNLYTFCHRPSSVSAALFCVLANFAFASNAMQFSTVVNPGTTAINNVTGDYGARFINTTGEDVVITEIGRWVLAGNKQKHTLRVYDNYGPLLGEAVIDCAGAPSGQFLFGKLPSPVTVGPGGIIYILSSETAGGDSFYHGFSRDAQTTSRDIGIIETGFFDPTIPSLKTGGGIGLSWGPVSFKYTSPVPTWTKKGSVYTTNGNYYQIVSAMNDASPGDTIRIPAGTFTWGDNGTVLNINKPVIIEGAGVDKTIINQSATAPSGWTSSFIRLGDGATFRRVTINGADAHAGVFATGAASDWRISEVKYVQHPGRNPYFVFAQYAPRGLIDNCDITGGAGNSELVFARGPADAWDTASPVGTENNIFIEDCIFRGAGYVCDANSNGRIVVRNTTITGGIKVDSHGVWSNGGPQRGARSLETYRNRWTHTVAGGWAAIEYRGGTGMIWGNRADTTVQGAAFFLTEYGVFNNNGAFTPNYQTPADYPIRDQIGRGQYKVAGDWTTATSEPIYMWDNLKAGAPWPLAHKNIPQASIDRYRAQTQNSAATFGWEDIIQADRDYFRQGASFDGSTGVGVGTKAQMLSIKATKPGVGFWVTDEGDWDSTNPGPDGQLYVWDGSKWVLKYRPYTYPHPLRSGNTPPPPSEPPPAPTPPVPPKNLKIS